MNKVIGTAGHVDHGKSALIYALTGKSMMRLPEEKRRGITIDLGFASFSPNSDFKIGVIDVPGHERFIRNMVAGMWSLDLVMIVVCASEGWMTMTEEHAKVALSLGIKNVICVINKIDLVDDELLLIQEDAINKNLIRIFNRNIDILKVSSINGVGIEILQNKIVDVLVNSNDDKEINLKPYIYIDRVFTVKGAGATVTGSLKSGSIKIDDTLIHYPSEKEVSIRSIESFNEEKSVVTSVSRVAINIRNFKKEDFNRGNLLAFPSDDLFLTKEIILELSNNYNAESFVRYKNIEFAFGTDCVIAEPIPLFVLGKDGEKSIDKRFLRLRFNRSVALFWKANGVLISHGGSSIIGAGYVFWALSTNVDERRRIASIAESYLGYREPRVYNDLFMAVKGFTEYKDGLDIKNSVRISNLIVLESYLNDVKEKVLKLFDKKLPSGEYMTLSFDNIKNSLSIDHNFLNQFIAHLIKEKVIISFANGYKKYQAAADIKLSKSQESLFNTIKNNAENGIEEKYIKSIVNGALDIKALISFKLVVFLGDGLYYNSKTYDDLKAKLMEGVKSGDIITIVYCKEKLGLSRKYTIPILNGMERDGILKRKENDRIVI